MHQIWHRNKTEIACIAWGIVYSLVQNTKVVHTFTRCTTLALLPLKLAEELLSVAPDLYSCLCANVLCKMI